MRKKYKSIFFDLDNTLWDFDKNSMEALKLTYLEYGIHNLMNDFDKFYHTYHQINDACWKEYREKKITKQELIFKRFQDTLDTFSIKGINPDQFNDKYLSVMAEQVLLVDGAISILDYLRAKNYKLYIITNGFKEVQHKKLKKTDLAKYFHRVFISDEVKAPKPQKEIFEHAFKSTNSSKKDSLMIGDSWESDIIGANNFGIDQIYYAPKSYDTLLQEDKLSLKNSKILTIKIKKLEEIQEIL